MTRCLLCELVKAINDKLKSEAHNQNEPATIYTGPPVIRVTLASVEETSTLLSRGLDFYGATYFPTETPHPAAQPLAKYKNNRWETNVRACICPRYIIPPTPRFKSISIYRVRRFTSPIPAPPPSPPPPPPWSTFIFASVLLIGYLTRCVLTLTLLALRMISAHLSLSFSLLFSICILTFFFLDQWNIIRRLTDFYSNFWMCKLEKVKKLGNK